MKICLIVLLLCLSANSVAQERNEAMDQSALENAVKQEIEDLHAFFVGWYNGALPKSAYETGFLAKLDTGFTIIMPSGTELNYEQLCAAMKASFGKKPGFQIEILKVRLVESSETMVVATYEEWQHNDLEGPDSASARISTVVFERGDSLSWRHVHETWLPE
ncbi:MAG: nuclear transport factor 2 family protein [Xanthomonadales bacterium]|nr:nuclear transport factor 2 family protein [Xanthomonadales bacterium]